MTATIITETIETAPAPRAAQLSATLRCRRDGYGALAITVTDGTRRAKLVRAWDAIQAVVDDLERGSVDEHRAPAWETGIDWDRKRDRGQAVNLDYYGLDLVNGQPLAVVQVRQFTRGKRWTTIRKNWFLVGRNETGTSFAHPVSGRVIQNALKRDDSPESAVTAARAWIFEVAPDRLPDILRHGDTALVPVAKPPPGERTIHWQSLASMQLVDAHVLSAAECVAIGERIYARDPYLHHAKEQHADVSGRGWYRVQIGLRADVWPFSRPTAD